LASSPIRAIGANGISAHVVFINSLLSTNVIP
jgi:hypothetical protein